MLPFCLTTIKVFWAKRASPEPSWFQRDSRISTKNHQMNGIRRRDPLTARRSWVPRLNRRRTANGSSFPLDLVPLSALLYQITIDSVLSHHYTVCTSLNQLKLQHMSKSWFVCLLLTCWHVYSHIMQLSQLPFNSKKSTVLFIVLFWNTTFNDKTLFLVKLMTETPTLVGGEQVK